MSNNFDGPILIDQLDPTDYIGFGRSGYSSVSTGPRILPTGVNPNYTITAPAGSLALSYENNNVALWQNVDGATSWSLVGGTSTSTGVRAYTNAAESTSTIYVGTQATQTQLPSDVTGDGSVQKPFATIAHALQATPWLPGIATTKTIQLGTGSFSAPVVILGWRRVNIVGNTSTEASYTISATPGNTASTGIRVTVNGGVPVPGWALNNQVGKIVQFTSGTLNNFQGVIYANTTTDAWISPTSASTVFQAPAIGNTFNVLTLNSTITLNTSGGLPTVICASPNLRFVNCAMTSTNDLFLFSTGQVRFSGCDLRMRTIILSDQGFFDATYIRGTGLTFGDEGLLSVRANGLAVFSGGVVIDGQSANAGASTMLVQPGGAMAASFETVFLNLSEGPRFSGCTVAPITGFTGYRIFRFVNSGGIGVNDSASQPNNGGGLSFPDLQDTDGALTAITSNYCLTARGAPSISIGSASSVVSLVGTNAVSADNGTSNVSVGPDGTRIYNGSPTATPEAGPLVSLATNQSISTQSRTTLVDTTAGNVSLTLPTAASVTKGTRYTFKKTVVANNIILVRSGADSIEGVAGNYTFGAGTLATATVESDGVSAWWVTGN